MSDSDKVDIEKLKKDIKLAADHFTDCLRRGVSPASSYLFLAEVTLNNALSVIEDYIWSPDILVEEVK